MNIRCENSGTGTYLTRAIASNCCAIGTCSGRMLRSAESSRHVACGELMAAWQRVEAYLLPRGHKRTQENPSFAFRNAWLFAHSAASCQAIAATGLRDFAIATPAQIQRPLARITSAIPPSTAADASSRCNVTGSPSNMTPPIVAMAGTLSWTVAAVVALRPCSAVYQTA